MYEDCIIISHWFETIFLEDSPQVSVPETWWLLQSIVCLIQPTIKLIICGAICWKATWLLNVNFLVNICIDEGIFDIMLAKTPISIDYKYKHDSIWLWPTRCRECIYIVNSFNLVVAFNIPPCLIFNNIAIRICLDFIDPSVAERNFFIR